MCTINRKFNHGCLSTSYCLSIGTSADPAGWKYLSEYSSFCLNDRSALS